jgi:hypothetical protein
MTIIRKDEDDKVVVTIDWSGWLGSSTIASVAWDEPSNNLTISNESETTTATTAYLSGGTNGRDYWVQVAITTADAVARIESRWIEVRVMRKQYG